MVPYVAAHFIFSSTTQHTTNNPLQFIPISPCHRFKWVQLFFWFDALIAYIAMHFIHKFWGFTRNRENIWKTVTPGHAIPSFCLCAYFLSLFLTPCLRMMMMKSYVPFAFFFLFLLSCDLYLRKLNCSETGLWIVMRQEFYYERQFWFSLISSDFILIFDIFYQHELLVIN